MTIQIKSMINSSPQEPWDVRIDRATLFGNPYAMNNKCTRDSACDQFQQHFDTLLAHPHENRMFIEALSRLLKLYKKYGKVNLYCWCAPRRCHGETYKRWLEEQI